VDGSKAPHGVTSLRIWVCRSLIGVQLVLTFVGASIVVVHAEQHRTWSSCLPHLAYESFGLAILTYESVLGLGVVLFVVCNLATHQYRDAAWKSSIDLVVTCSLTCVGLFLLVATGLCKSL